MRRIACVDRHEHGSPNNSAVVGARLRPRAFPGTPHRARARSYDSPATAEGSLHRCPCDPAKAASQAWPRRCH
ncbi:hypothetical protein EIQ10_16075 [Xanthomonas campestris pv. campestris]